VQNCLIPQTEIDDLNRKIEDITKENKDLVQQKKDTEKICNICINTVEDEFYKTKCLHNFHPECITNWLKVNETCPNCRNDLEASYTSLKILIHKADENIDKFIANVQDYQYLEYKNQSLRIKIKTLEDKNNAIQKTNELLLTNNNLLQEKKTEKYKSLEIENESLRNKCQSLQSRTDLLQQEKKNIQEENNSLQKKQRISAQ
jgi:hypothetical protein